MFVSFVDLFKELAFGFIDFSFFLYFIYLCSNPYNFLGTQPPPFVNVMSVATFPLQCQN